MDVETQPQSSSSVPARAALAAAAAAALLASACCLAPLAFVLVGVSGAWMSQLAGFEPYQPYFLAGGAAALAYAGQKIWSAPACDDGRPCAVPAAKRAQKVVFVAVAGLMVLVLGLPLVAPLFY